MRALCLLLSLLLATAPGCGLKSTAGSDAAAPGAPAADGSGASNGAPGAVEVSSLPRVTDPAPAGDVARATAGSTDLGLDLYRALGAEGSGNLVLSPASISIALSMLYAGAAGDTEGAIATALRSGLAQPAHHRAMNDLDRQLASRGGGASIRMANQFFAQDGFAFHPSYLDTLAREYGAGVRLLDFKRAWEPARQAVNAWVSERTDTLIPELFPAGTIDRYTRSVIVNAIVFKGVWERAFDPTLTRAAPFTRLDGTSAQVQMMVSSSPVARAATVDGVTVAALPYDGRQLSFVVLMPAAGTFAAFEAGLTAAKLDGYVAGLGWPQAVLSLPRFTVTKNTDLKIPLDRLGLHVLFTEASDFTRLTPESPFPVQNIVHDAVVKLDEAGTVAAAATGIASSGGGSAPPALEHVVVDRPFVFLVRDDATGAVLFLGRVVAP